MTHPSEPHTDTPGPAAGVGVQPAEGLRQRALPFLFAIALGLLLLPLQEAPIDGPLLAASVALLAVIVGGGIAVDRARGGLPTALFTALPYAFLLAIALLREATGGFMSGYGALLFLAPFWVALYDRRRMQLVFVILAMGVVLAVQGLAEEHFDTIAPLRSALLITVVVGFMSLGVQRTVLQIRETKDQLRRESRALEQANTELAEANDALAQSNKELEQFAYVSSHDLQEPLRMIRSFSQLFMQRHADGLSDEGRELIGFVTDGAERAQHLVTDLLDYSRVGSSTREFETVDLDEVLDRALGTLGSTIEETEADVRRAGALPSVEGDPVQLERLFVNLVGNSLRYHAPDRAPTITIEARDTAPGVEVRITDNGIGFDDEHAERIFKMFHRLHGRSEYPGTGIGLAICERIVERHGGTIRATGRPGEGATFTFTLGART